MEEAKPPSPESGSFASSPPVSSTDLLANPGLLLRKLGVVGKVSVNGDSANSYLGDGFDSDDELDMDAYDRLLRKNLAESTATNKRTEQMKEDADQYYAAAEERHDDIITAQAAQAEATDAMMLQQQEAEKNIMANQEEVAEEIVSHQEEKAEEIMTKIADMRALLVAKHGDPAALKALEQKIAQLEREKKLAAKDQHVKEVQSRKQIQRLADANALLNSQLEEKSRKHLRARKARAISGLTEVSANRSAAAPVGKRTVVAEAKHCGRHTDEAKDEADEIWKKKCSFLSTKR